MMFRYTRPGHKTEIKFFFFMAKQQILQQSVSCWSKDHTRDFLTLTKARLPVDGPRGSFAEYVEWVQYWSKMTYCSPSAPLMRTSPSPLQPQSPARCRMARAYRENQGRAIARGWFRPRAWAQNSLLSEPETASIIGLLVKFVRMDWSPALPRLVQRVLEDLLFGVLDEEILLHGSTRGFLVISSPLLLDLSAPPQASKPRTPPQPYNPSAPSPWTAISQAWQGSLVPLALPRTSEPAFSSFPLSSASVGVLLPSGCTIVLAPTLSALVMPACTSTLPSWPSTSPWLFDLGLHLSQSSPWFQLASPPRFLPPSAPLWTFIPSWLWVILLLWLLPPLSPPWSSPCPPPETPSLCLFLFLSLFLSFFLSLEEEL